MAALAGREVAAILVSHTHRDHSPGARALKAATGAPIHGCARHWAARDLALGEINALDASADRDHAPDHVLADGETVAGEGWTLTALETPGHTMNHLCFALAEENALFSADHVMAWSTSIVAPPDGSMRAYMDSLERLKARQEAIYWPGHGGPVTDPNRFVRALITHRHMREQSVVNALQAGIGTIAAMVPRIYEGLDPRLVGAASLSCFAHLEDLVARGLATCDTPAPTLQSRYAPG
jgi:glyoxylase-like metal-dependent hydrolase (beta-lactamase superfamily II)